MPDLSPLSALCQAVVDDLNGVSAQFAPPLEVTLDEGDPAFVAVRGYIPRYKLPEVATRRVVVCPAGVKTGTLDRGHGLDELRIAIGVLKLLPPGAGDSQTDQVNLDALDRELLFVDQLVRRFAPDDQSFYDLGEAWRATGVENDPAYDFERLHECQQFQSVILVTFEEVRG